ncbi:MAG: preprotein translocase subunit SecE [Bacilli bacterium]|jgi:preprotein translocase SecE subunit
MGLGKYTGEVIREGKRVRWPKSEEFWPTIAVVLFITIFAAIILSLEDLAAVNLLNALKEIFKGLKG